MVRNSLYIVLILALVFLLYVMTALSVSRYTFANAVKQNIKAEYPLPGKPLSIGNALKALVLLPVGSAPLLCRTDHQVIHAYAGKTLLAMAEKIRGRGSADDLNLLEAAEDQYRQSLAAAPGHIISARGLAMTIFQREKAFSSTYPEKQNPFNALPYFKTLFDLGPNLVDNNFLLADYYFYKGMDNELFQTVAHLAFIYPSQWYVLKKRSFYQPWLEPAVIEGLERAVEQQVHPKTALFALARLMTAKGERSRAVAYCTRAMNITPHTNREKDHLFLGSLMLNDNNPAGANREFKLALAPGVETAHSLNIIFQAFKKHGDMDGFLTFAKTIQHNQALPELGKYIARARMALGLYPLARAGLEVMAAQTHDAEVFYLLAIIAEGEKDWDTMELNLHRAIALAPDHCTYYRLFARALSRQGKKVQTEWAQQKARECSERNKK